MISPGSRPASSAPRRYAAITGAAFFGSPSVQTPSASLPATSAAPSLNADRYTRRAALRLQVEAGALRAEELALEVDPLPSSSRVMIVSASSVRLSWSAGAGQSAPAGISFIASLLPAPRKARPGKSCSSVATCWATTTGL